MIRSRLFYRPPSRQAKEFVGAPQPAVTTHTHARNRGSPPLPRHSVADEVGDATQAHAHNGMEPFQNRHTLGCPAGFALLLQKRLGRGRHKVARAGGAVECARISVSQFTRHGTRGSSLRTVGGKRSSASRTQSHAARRHWLMASRARGMQRVPSGGPPSAACDAM